MMFKNILIVLLLSVVCAVHAGTFDLGVIPSPSCLSVSQELASAFNPVGNCAGGIIDNQLIANPNPLSPLNAYGHFALCRSYDANNKSQYIVSYIPNNDTANPVTVSCPSKGDLILFTVALLPTSVITGVVIDSTTNLTVPGAIISAGDVQTTTGADGTYSLSVLNGTTITISANASGYAVSSTTVVVTHNLVVNFAIAPPPYMFIYVLWDTPNSYVESYYYIDGGCTITLENPTCDCADSDGYNIVPTLYAFTITHLIGCNSPALFAVYPTLAPEPTLVEVQILTIEGQFSWIRNISDFAGANLGYWRVFETASNGDIYNIDDIVASNPTAGIF